MEKQVFIIVGCLLVSLISCKKDNAIVTSSCNNQLSVNSRNVTPHLTPYIDWEDTSLIAINKIGNVTLPWYSGSKGAIPDFILNDYKREDGWELLYNFCSDTQENAEGGKNFIIYYNVILGKLRVFYYNKDFITTGNATIAQFKADRATRIFNFNKELYSPSIEEAPSIQEITRTNLTTFENKATGLGWNCFDVLLAYDPISSPEYLHIGFYDQNIKTITLNGILNMETNGTVTTTSVSNPLNWLIEVGGEAAGNAAQKAWDNGIRGKKDEKTRGVIGSLVSGIVTKGIGNLFGSFIAKFNKVDEKKSTIELTSEGKVDFNGSINSVQSAAIPSLQNILMPGASSNGNNQVLPHYDKQLGVWNIKKLPTVKLDDVLTGEFYNVPTPTSLPSNIYCYVADYHRGASFSLLDKDDIVINPEILEYIESYEVATSFYVVTKYKGTENRYPNQYLKKCIYETSLTNEWTESVKKTLFEDIDTQFWLAENYAEFQFQDAGNPQFTFSSNDKKYITEQLTREKYIKPSFNIPDNYLAKVKLTIKFKGIYEGKQIVYSQTVKPKVEIRNVNRTDAVVEPLLHKRTGDPNGKWEERWEHDYYTD